MTETVIVRDIIHVAHEITLIIAVTPLISDE